VNVAEVQLELEKSQTAVSLSKATSIFVRVFPPEEYPVESVETS